MANLLCATRLLCRDAFKDVIDEPRTTRSNAKHLKQIFLAHLDDREKQRFLSIFPSGYRIRTEHKADVKFHAQITHVKSSDTGRSDTLSGI